MKEGGAVFSQCERGVGGRENKNLIPVINDLNVNIRPTFYHSVTPPLIKRLASAFEPTVWFGIYDGLVVKRRRSVALRSPDVNKVRERRGWGGMDSR